MEAFIVRPFGVKDGIDFEKVHNDLIKPALTKVGIRGATTGVIVEQGNIREDMFSKLLTAELVIADISIHNANVFYELGVRHALQDKGTFLIRSSKDEVPFDLKTDRYMSYQTENPALCIEQLAAGLRATLLNLQTDKKDSPVFSMLPNLVAQDRERFVVVPSDFREEVDNANDSREPGKLAMLAEEAESFEWFIPALRFIGHAQVGIKQFEAAQVTWEKIRNENPNDREANDQLATIYQRLADSEIKVRPNIGKDFLNKSDTAIERLLQQHQNLDREKRAQVFSLKGRNTKFRWMDNWKRSSADKMCKNALQSKFLIQAYEEYQRGYQEDLNHFYSGSNALGLLTTLISLAESLPEDWIDYNDNEEEAAIALKKYKDKRQKLAMVVEASIEAEKERLQDQGQTNAWLDIAEADLYCMISSRPQRVSNMYRDALLSSSDMNFDAALRQLQMYEQLNVCSANVQAAIGEFLNQPQKAEGNKRNYILFTGHMIDKKDRPSPRFPKEKESAVRTAIREAVQSEKLKADGPLLGISGGACGGDIIFHEVCAELGIETELYLAIPRDQFVVESVQFAGEGWVERFNKLYITLQYKVLSATKKLPRWLQKKEDYSIWERNNLWMLNSALVCGGIQLSLIALWDGKGGDGVGGTQHMVRQAQARGGKTITLDINKIS